MVDFDKDADNLADGFGVSVDRLDELMHNLDGMVLMDGIATALTMPDITVSERLVILINIGFSFGQAKLLQQQQAQSEIFGGLPVQ